jgi:hypothetical protein
MTSSCTRQRHSQIFMPYPPRLGVDLAMLLQAPGETRHVLAFEAVSPLNVVLHGSVAWVAQCRIDAKPQSLLDARSAGQFQWIGASLQGLEDICLSGSWNRIGSAPNTRDVF